MNTVNVHRGSSSVGSDKQGVPSEVVSEESRRPTIKDVALVAGVSHATVSRVLNGSDAVRPTTRTRVLEAIVRTGWTPDEVAAALGRRKGRTAVT